MPGAVDVRADTLTVTTGGAVSSSTAGPGDAGQVQVRAAGLLDVNGGSIETNSSSSGAAGDVTLAATRLRVRDDGLVGSSGTGTGPAGDVRIAGQPARGAGRLDPHQRHRCRGRPDRGRGRRADLPAPSRGHLQRHRARRAGASVITLAAPQIVLNASTVTSLTGDGQPLAGSGEASLLGDVTVISADSLVAGSSSVVISGLQTNLGSDLQLPSTVFLDASRLLRDSCAATGAGPRSSFTRGGRGGLPPAPDRPLPSAGAEGSAPAPADLGWRLPMTLTACDPDAPAEPTT